jgi:hypothetical protein
MQPQQLGYTMKDIMDDTNTVLWHCQPKGKNYVVLVGQLYCLG